MEYFIRGTAHFFNLFADFLEHCENIIYFIFLLILLILILFTLKKDKGFKSTLFNLGKSYLTLFKYIIYDILIIILLFASIWTYKLNNQFKILSLLVVIINFVIASVNVYDNNLFDENNNILLKYSDFKNIIVTNIVLVFFKITYWAEIYVFNISEIKEYFIIMIIIILSEIFVMIGFKIYSIYDIAFKFVKKKSNYYTIHKITDFIKILTICSNKINYFRLVRIFLQNEVITKENHSNIVSFCLYYKAIINQLNCTYDYEKNYKIYKDYINVNKRIDSGNYE